MLQFLTSLIFPPICISCSHFGIALCPDCLSKLKFAPCLICPICLKQSSNGLKHNHCSGDIDGLIFLFRYEKTLQRIIKQIKYSSYSQSFYPLMDFYLQHLEINSDFKKFLNTQPILVPVPIHKQRQKDRGFNQSHIMAKCIAQIWNLPISQKIIIRSKNTPHQSMLSKKNRLKNVIDAFLPTKQILKLNSQPLYQENILLIDDVFTTGSTAKECAKVLKNLGAKQIWVLTLAHGK